MLTLLLIDNEPFAVPERIHWGHGENMASSFRKSFALRSRYGGVTIAEAKENKRLREENTRLKCAVADLTLDNQILQ